MGKDMSSTTSSILSGLSAEVTLLKELAQDLLLALETAEQSLKNANRKLIPKINSARKEAIK